ncbi:MAG: hypothetical protein ACYC96_14275 [Fimbriimonadaceae bacterium]
MSVVYTVWDGQIISENRGGVERDYIPDPLGNTIALVDNTRTITDTWSYWAYGEVQNRTGPSTTPFTYVGTLGYFVDQVNRLYARARSLRSDLTRWATVDPLWPTEVAYAYVNGRPSHRGPSGAACTPHSQASVAACLRGVANGYNCRPGNGCPQPGHPIVPALAMCVLYYENGMCDGGGGQSGKGGGMGQLTDGAIHDLICSGCNKVVTGKAGTTGDDWCAGALAAFMWMKCRGLQYPGGYGDSSSGPPNNGLQKIEDCAACVRRGGSVFACARQTIGVRP